MSGHRKMLGSHPKPGVVGKAKPRHRKGHLNAEIRQGYEHFTRARQRAQEISKSGLTTVNPPANVWAIRGQALGKLTKNE